MPEPITTKTYNNQQIDQEARAVFMAALAQAKPMLNGEAPFNTEKMLALGEIANAAESAIQYGAADDDEI
jgi:hypothetical protein